MSQHIAKRTRRQFIATAAGLAASTSSAQQSRRKPNFIILFADDMGYGDLSCYGHPTIRTPNLDRMAEEGIRFTSFYAAAPVCTPSRVGLLTGRYPVRAGLPNNLGPDSIGGLPLTEILLPQLLKQAGYKTMAIGKWHLGHNPKTHLPTSRGFDDYFGLLYSNDMIPPWVKTTKPLELHRGTEPVERVDDQTMLTERYTEEAIKFIKSSGKSPFFLYLPYAMPHLPISASSKFESKSRAGLYGDVIETLDWSYSQILKTVKEQGIDNDTLIIFASDNGPWQNLPQRMFAKGVEPWHTGTKSLLRGAKATTYEGGQRVPCIMRWPGTIPPRQTNADIASTLDLLPTLTAAAGIPLPKDRTYDGFDLRPTITKGAPSPRENFFYFRGATLEAIREKSWKYRYTTPIQGEGSDSGTPIPELFNLDRDPAEMYNVAGRHPEITESLKTKMRLFASDLKAKLIP